MAYSRLGEDRIQATHAAWRYQSDGLSAIRPVTQVDQRHLAESSANPVIQQPAPRSSPWRRLSDGHR